MHYCSKIFFETDIFFQYLNNHFPFFNNKYLGTLRIAAAINIP